MNGATAESPDEWPMKSPIHSARIRRIVVP